MKPKENQRILCAIYTRKSTDENMKSDFTSLDAQRESAVAYIKSQQSEGWELYPDRYDDPGFSGGTIERPGLQRLLRDAQDGKFQMVIVYKVDRLTRSLKDFTKIVEVLEDAGVSFVAVTQQFNTSSSMGRLTLNVLLSFAQFEREIIGERTRDKRMATAKKGKWLGGVPLLGYDINFETKSLVVNKQETALVKTIFETYQETKSAIKTAHILNTKGYRCKTWVTREGVKRGGAKFNKNQLLNCLKNPAYIGMIKYKDEQYPAEHPPLIDKKTFDATQALIAHNCVSKNSPNREGHDYLLSGLIRCACCKSIMTPTSTQPRGKKYLYYKCTKVHHLDRSACAVRVVGAREIENIIIDRLKVLSDDKNLLEKIIRNAKIGATDELQGLQQELNTQTAELRKTENEANGLIGALTANRESLGNNKFISKRLNELEEKNAAIEARIQEIRLAKTKLEEQNVNAEVIQRNFVTFARVFDKLTMPERTELLHLLIKEIVYDGIKHEIEMALRPLPDIGPFLINGSDKVFEPRSLWLPGMDLNHERLSQSQVCCQLQHRAEFFVSKKFRAPPTRILGGAVYSRPSTGSGRP